MTHIPDRYKKLGFTHVGQKRKSTLPNKKWMVLAKKGDAYKIVHGGQKGMEDYTQHHDKERRKRFWQRMGGIDSKHAKDPFSALYWHKKFGTWEDGGILKKGTIKTAWINEFNSDILESKMYDSIEEAIKNSEGKEYLVFELEDSQNGHYVWKLLPYGMHKEYKVSSVLNQKFTFQELFRKK